MQWKKVLVIALIVLCILSVLLNRRVESETSESDAESYAAMRQRLRALPPPDSPATVTPDELLAKNFNNFSYFYRLSQAHMDSSMYWIDYRGSNLPLLRVSADEEHAGFRASIAAKWLASQSLAVVAAVRNGMPGLRTSVDNLRRLCSKFARCSIVFLESDSSDGTREFLYQLSKSDPSVTVIGCGTINSPQPCLLKPSYSSGKQHQTGPAMKRSFQDEIERGLVMSALRNQLLAYAYTHLADTHSLLLGIDPDLYWDPWEHQSLLQGLYYFASRPQLDSLCASVYYLVSGGRVIYDPCTLDFFDKDKFGVISPDTYSERNTAVLRTGRWPIKVNSCFQGLTFYRMSSLRNRRLLYRRGHGEWICEHNTLSRQLGENYIDPNMQLRVRTGRFLQ